MKNFPNRRDVLFILSGNKETYWNIVNFLKLLHEVLREYGEIIGETQK